jgi:molecular chaperone DnaJ
MCKGVGEVEQIQQTVFGQFANRTSCPRCGGEGKIISKKCSECKGEGRLRTRQTLKVKIPEGINEGERIRLQGQGEAGTRSEQSGDLYITIRIKSDSRFKRDGDDIRSTAGISIADAVLGATLRVHTVDGDVNLKIPSGTESGKEFILKGKGVPHLRSRGRGNHFVTVEVMIPKRLNKEQKRMFEALQTSGL